MGGDARRFPEPAHPVDIRRREVHVRRELIGEAADLASAHCVGLPGQRKRRRARLADPARGQMTVEDRVDLVGTLRRLIDALRIKRHRARRFQKHLEECRDVSLGQARGQRRRADAARDAPRPCQRVIEATCVFGNIFLIERAIVGEMRQQSGEQRGVRSRLEAQKQIGIAGGFSLARIDHHDTRAAILFVGDHSLEQHRMAPRGI